MILMQVLKVEKIKKNDADYGDENNRRKKLWCWWGSININ
jgi:hypothetical protein